MSEILNMRNVETSSLTVDIIDDETIRLNNLQPVTSPIFFENGGMPKPEGLYSDVIFGTTSDEKRRTMAYIDLKGKYFHPYVFERLSRIMIKLKDVKMGIKSWEITEAGELKEVPPTSEKYNEENTGLKWLIDNFDKIKFERNNSRMRNETIDMIEELRKSNQIFITKWIVIPPFYRNYKESNGRRDPDEITSLYSKLISRSSYMDTRFSDSQSNNMLMSTIQDLLIEIRRNGQKLIEKKDGFFKKGVLGKNPDYGSRSVISTQTFENCSRPEDNPIDALYTGLPMAQCCSAGFPFVARWISEFFRKEFESHGVNYPVYEKNSVSGKFELVYKELDDPLSIYTQDYIKTRIELFTNTYTSRFDPIEIPIKNNVDGKKYYMIFSGQLTGEKQNDVLASTISNRPFTWTDLLYIACVESLVNKHIYITRYPLLDYFSQHPTRIHVLSTVNTISVKIGETIYEHYPLVNYNASETEISTSFIDTMVMSNIYLEGLGNADFDGDMCSIKMVYSEEANAEAEKILFSLQHYMTIQGSIIRTMDKDFYLTYYGLTLY